MNLLYFNIYNNCINYGDIIVTDCINSRSLEECINKLESIGCSNKGKCNLCLFIIVSTKANFFDRTGSQNCCI
jgi:hypothetical protein